MTYHNRDLDRIARNLISLIDDEIVKSGIFYRIFFRAKGIKSLKTKLSVLHEDGSLKYDAKTKLLRDIIGLRINLYFVDDLDLVKDFLRKKLSNLYVEETIDENTTTEFKPTRINLVFRIPYEYATEFNGIISDSRIDSTFELQLRTIFSEGWHEVEHDLRYKCQSDWDNYPDLARTFNGILASLETHEWSIIQLFDRLSYSHYKSVNTSAMIRTKLRLRFEDFNISPNVLTIIESEEIFLKEFFKIERNNVVNLLLINQPQFPLTIDNIIFLVNFFFINHKPLNEITPSALLEEFRKLKKTSS